MASAKIAAKIAKDKGVSPNELEEEIAKALHDIEVAPSHELKADLKDFRFTKAIEVECPGGRSNKATVLMTVPYVTYTEMKKNIPKLVRELEKKFAKKYFVIVAQRTIMDTNFRRKGNKTRPRSRTLTAVHESILEDVVYPSEICAKRTAIRTDGSKLIKITLDKKERADAEDKLHVFHHVYKTLTHKEAVFSL
jgi:small subunit ribosomal protein S7e